MKKFIIILVAIFGISLTANAQSAVCRVIGGDNATVVVSVVDFSEDGKVNITIASDSDIPVNVTFTIGYRVTGITGDCVYTLTETAEPCRTNRYTIQLPQRGEVWTIRYVKVEGARCERN